MAYIQKRKKKREPRRESEARHRQRDIYRTERWKRLRTGYIMEHPLCELCEARGIVTLAVDVHHKDSFGKYQGSERLWKAYNPANLVALCKECHSWLHRGGVTFDLDTEHESKVLDEEFGKGIKPYR
jgi:5-methylcytosine-specific restriction protein A